MNIDENQRIWIEIKPKDPDSLVELGESIYGDSYKPYQAEYLHVTLFHFGTVKGILSKLNEAETYIATDKFKIDFYELLKNTQSVLENNITVTTDRIDIFGNEKQPKAVLVIKQYDELREANRFIHSHVVTLFKSYGVHDAQELLMNSTNFRFSTPAYFNPHLTLGIIKEFDRFVAYPYRIDELEIKMKPSSVAKISLD